MTINNIKISKIIFFILSLFVFLWIVLNIIRTGNNLLKVYAERHLIFASDENKRFEIFGELHPFFEFVRKTTEENSTILFLITNRDIDSSFYYLSYYYLYPRKVKYISQKELKQNIVFNRDVYLITFEFLRDKKEDINNSIDLNLFGVYSGQKYLGKIYSTKK